MDPGIREDSVHWRNCHARGRIAVDHNQIIGIEIGIHPLVKTPPRVFEKDRISGPMVRSLRIIFEEERVARVGGQDDLRDGGGPGEQKRAKTVNNLWM